MKKLFVYGIILISAIVFCLLVYSNNQRQIHTTLNHLLNPSPVSWRNVVVYYQDELICRKNDNGLLFLAWGPTPEGFVGVGGPYENSAQEGIANVKKSNKYYILNDSETIIDGNEARSIECINNATQEYTLFIFVIQENIMILYAGPKENLPIFQKTIGGIKIKKS
jgi:hypothetical protein